MATVHVLLDAIKKVATLGEYVDVEYFEVNVDAKKYRFGKREIDEETAAPYDYRKINYIILGEEAGRSLVDALIPAQYKSLIERSDEFRAWSYVDMSARVVTGQLPNYYVERLLRVRYTVTDTIVPEDGSDPYEGTVNVSNTIRDWGLDDRPDKTWGQAYMPVKWYGKVNE